MLPRHLLAVGAVMVLVTVGRALGDEVRYFEKDGVTWRETRRAVQRPIVETRMQETTRTVYREQLATEYRDTVRNWWTPVSETRCEAVWAGRWNPFVEPRLEYRPVTRTRWEQRTEVVQTPVVCRRLTPQAQTVRVPVTTHRMVQDEVISRVAMGVSPTLASRPVTTAGERIGGMAHLESDPPRYGVNAAWRPSQADRR